jgi:hypothetical protein
MKAPVCIICGRPAIAFYCCPTGIGGAVEKVQFCSDHAPSANATTARQILIDDLRAKLCTPTEKPVSEIQFEFTLFGREIDVTRMTEVLSSTPLFDAGLTTIHLSVVSSPLVHCLSRWYPESEADRIASELATVISALCVRDNCQCVSYGIRQKYAQC